MKGKLTKKAKIGIVGSMILAVILIIMVILNNAFKQNSSLKTVKTNDAELLRAMEYSRVEEGQEKVQITNEAGESMDFDYVEFDAFFLRDLDGDGYAEGVRGTCREIGKQDTLYMELNVLTKGYLKDAKVTLNGDRNFYFETAIVKDNEVNKNYIDINTNEICFNKLSNGTQKLLTGTVKSGNYNSIYTKADAIGTNINNLSKINSITLTGTHVEELEDGTLIETPIEKTDRKSVV